ncbi:MAG: 1-deoxy-D-xylulose-5-phosphate synthase [Chloroflexi bacterium]|nr:1-deoxy-D-xylulose-5-phosphate synthase [Chloroflexota bacterium]
MPRILDRINQPADLSELSAAELETLAREIREELVDTITMNGGHLASNLGAVELTIALHSVFHSPWDKIVWDVGHQSYVHKLLTGRRSSFNTIRQHGGLSGFPSRNESVHDAFGSGHASTSVSAALGMAIARDLKGGQNRVIAVIGDGAMSGGMAFEGLNNAGHLGSKLIVILNDNEMSIDPNVGAMAKYLNRLRANPSYNEAKGRIEKSLLRLPFGNKLAEFFKRMKHSFKELVIPTMIWEELGFTYLGPVDGHDIQLLRETLQLAQLAMRPVFVHVITKKGKGYNPAEIDATEYHGIAPNGGKAKKPGARSYTSVFADTLVELAENNERIVAITAAMTDGTGLKAFSERFPRRFFDVGIAEQHAVTFAAGLAAEGLRPVVAVYSTFLQRAYDQVVHDVCAQSLPVTFAIDRAGIVGEDGRTHQGAFDLSYLRHVPEMIVMAPKDENELRWMLKTAIEVDRPAAVRYPRGAGVGVSLDGEYGTVPVGKGELLREGEDIAIVAVGNTVWPAMEAAEMMLQFGVKAAVVNARFVKPLDHLLLLDVGSRFSRIVTVEENVLAGGFGSAVLEFYQNHGLAEPHVHRIGISDRFVDHGPQGVLRNELGLSADGILREIGSQFPELSIGSDLGLSRLERTRKV